VNIGQIFFTVITQPIFNGLMILYHLFGDFGLSIVVLTLIIKLILFPLTVKSLKSMKATQALQPKMTEIRQKYKNDQQAQMQAMQALYKEHGVSPAAGCLPMLVQLPVLYGLFFALENGLGKATDKPLQLLHTVNSQLYSFVPHFTTPPDIALRWFTFLNPHWYISLAQPDPTHILPIVAGIATFVQLRMSQARQANNAPATDPTTQSMKMMQYVMPLVTVFIGWNFAAGLALYWTVSYIFQAVQQYFVTGWGSLLDIPGSGPKQGGSSSEKSDKKSTTRVVEGSIASGKAAGKSSQNGKMANQLRPSAQSDSEVEETEEEEETEQPISKSASESRARNTSRGSGPSQYNRRRQRGSSASARRRSSTRSRG
jgi:YidC/Oxa1 family membrane protein insertase